MLARRVDDGALEDLETYERHGLHRIKNTERRIGVDELKTHHLVWVRIDATIAEAPCERHQECYPVVVV